MENRVAQLTCAEETTQIVLVEYTGGTSAVLSLHEYAEGAWREILSSPAHTGKKGVGKMVEGDYKTPLGTFNLTTAFGILPDPGAQQPYIHINEYHCWCSCCESGHYNRLMDMRCCSHACAKPEEHLMDYPGAYDYAMFIDYNANGVPGRGSCIFLHCSGEQPHTAGCVAVPEDVMKKIICWAKPGAKIVIQK